MDDVTVTLNKCPPGLFWFGDTLGFKSEYTTTLENPGSYQCDAYVVASGEYFHGGARNAEERGNLLVAPVDAEAFARHRANHAQAEPVAPAQDVAALVAALTNLLDEYVSNVDSCRTGGFYLDPEKEECVIEARTALAKFGDKP